MINTDAWGVFDAGMAYSAESLRAVSATFAAAAQPAPATAHAGRAAHAATAAAAITPLRNRGTATATDAFVNRGST